MHATLCVHVCVKNTIHTYYFLRWKPVIFLAVNFFQKRIPLLLIMMRKGEYFPPALPIQRRKNQPMARLVCNHQSRDQLNGRRTLEEETRARKSWLPMRVRARLRWFPHIKPKQTRPGTFSFLSELWTFSASFCSLSISCSLLLWPQQIEEESEIG